MGGGGVLAVHYNYCRDCLGVIDVEGHGAYRRMADIVIRVLAVRRRRRRCISGEGRSKDGKVEWTNVVPEVATEGSCINFV